MNPYTNVDSLRTQGEKAAAFRRLHDGSRTFVLPNAWDAASARVFEEAGFAAVGTTSAGLAASLGYPDGEVASREEVVEATCRIANNVALPVSADIEGGYGRDAEGVGATVGAVVAAGTVGVNLEDAAGDGDVKPLRDISEQVERIRAAREVASSMGVEIVINARTDVYWLEVGREEERLDRAARRANAYREAGADCFFVPGVGDEGAIAALVREINGPLNVLAGPGVPPVPVLRELGVARLSVGSAPVRATLALLGRIARELLGPGTYEALTRDTISYAAVNELMSERGRRPHA